MIRGKNLLQVNIFEKLIFLIELIVRHNNYAEQNFSLYCILYLRCFNL